MRIEFYRTTSFNIFLTILKDIFLSVLNKDETQVKLIKNQTEVKEFSNISFREVRSEEALHACMGSLSQHND